MDAAGDDVDRARSEPLAAVDPIDLADAVERVEVEVESLRATLRPPSAADRILDLVRGSLSS